MTDGLSYGSVSFLEEVMMLQIYYTKRAYRISCCEADKHFQLGMEKEGRPHEAAMYPLSHVTLKPGVNKSPVELVFLNDIARVVVADIALVPDRYKDFSPYKCSFNAGSEGEEEMNRVMNQVVAEKISIHPCLDVIGKQHSHPFKGRAFLSAGDVAHSILNASDWYRAAGFNTMFSHVMTMSEEGVWTINNFALWKLLFNKRLPSAIVIGDNHTFAREAKRLPYYFSERGRTWCDSNKSELKRLGFNPRRGILRRGWRRYYLFRGEYPWLLITLPPFFPELPLIVYSVSSAKDGGFVYTKLELPDNWKNVSCDINDFSLSELANHFHRSLNQ